MTAYISLSDATPTPNQVREFQNALNAVADGDWRHKMIVLPPFSAIRRCSYCRSAVQSGRETCKTCGAPARA